MSEYTPDKNLIKECYIEAMKLETDSSDHAAEFDRWLAQHDIGVAKATEERTINVLKEEFLGYEYVRISVRDLLALIKRKEND